MRERVCKNCGGREYKVVGQNMIKCMFCGTLYVDEHASKEEEVLIVGAGEIVREMRFEDAVVEYDKILELFPLSFEAHFGKALAKNKIILFANRKGLVKRPRFFGKIVSISEDEDYKKALELAPAETAKTYSDIAKRIDKVKKQYDFRTNKMEYDVILCDVGFEDGENSTQVYEQLIKEGKEVYFLQKLPQKEQEEDTFRALETAKVFLLFANSNTGYAEFKHIYDRYIYFTMLRKKARSSFILAIDTQKVKQEQLPHSLSFCKSVLDSSSSTFLQDVQVQIKEEMAKSVNEIAKIETIEIQQVEPEKKTYLEIENVTPIDLGNYQVENMNAGDQTKIKWIYLCLKNGDFETASELTTAEIKKDPYNSNLLFADLMAEKQIKTKEEFFNSIKNFTNKEKIDNILRYANRQFASEFVDAWEDLIINLNEEELYNTYLLYLAGYKTSNRDNFIRHAENMAIETLNESLIEKVIKCFDSTDVDRFVEFYFLLAQKSENQEYYKKVLEIDPGHPQSNIAILLSHFNSNEDKLTYQNREEIENSLKYLDESFRFQFVSMVVDLVLPVAFLDLEKAQNQIDFYLAYISNEQDLASLTSKIASKFQEMRFFKVAEKYIAIAISKDKSNAEFYWTLIKIKAHCKSDNEIIVSQVKVMQMPEWETLLEIADDKQNEFYAQIVSKANLYHGERLPFEPDALDKKNLLEKLQDFILRNEKILLEADKEGEIDAIRGVRYYTEQLKPFSSYAETLQNIENYQKYAEIYDKINVRLKALDLSLESSVSTIKIFDNGGAGIKTTASTTSNKGQKKVKEVSTLTSEEKAKRDKFIAYFVCIFLEFFPVLFTAILLFITLISPKGVYMYFSQDFLIVSLMYSVAVMIFNLVLHILSKKKPNAKKWKIVFVSLMGIGVVNLAMFCFSFYLTPSTIGITNAKELQALMSNAKYATITLENDIDFAGETWKSRNFSGEFNGNGYTISNIVLESGGFVKTNNGTISNLTIQLQNLEITDVKNFGVIASKNKGEIVSCSVVGDIFASFEDDAVIGGLVGQNYGEISGCYVKLTIFIEAESGIVTVGGLVGEVCDAEQIYQNKSESTITINSSETSKLLVGGLLGCVDGLDDSSAIQQNISNCTISVSGTSTMSYVGGLVGYGLSPISDSRSEGIIDISALDGAGYVGGIYGGFYNYNLEYINHSYSTVQITASETTSQKFGTLVGILSGRMYNCFSSQSGDVVGIIGSYGGSLNCEQLATDVYYDSVYGFDETIWSIYSDQYPLLAWEK